MNIPAQWDTCYLNTFNLTTSDLRITGLREFSDPSYLALDVLIRGPIPNQIFQTLCPHDTRFPRESESQLVAAVLRSRSLRCEQIKIAGRTLGP